ncbi:hypothetical protein SCHPADRAFT_935825 [Schizopora paradoxa]|uniref:Uncharacterized protein n=1 Tax=Schizopora paradoxa TaxID=27342 RepID=A0A0H2S376_9AGAM|nr:hypothetical protein SCHPADRAFT_935825 [Schizopora paradoxa]
MFNNIPLPVTSLDGLSAYPSQYAINESGADLGVRTSNSPRIPITGTFPHSFSMDLPQFAPALGNAGATTPHIATHQNRERTCGKAKHNNGEKDVWKNKGPQDYAPPHAAHATNVSAQGGYGGTGGLGRFALDSDNREEYTAKAQPIRASIEVLGIQFAVNTTFSMKDLAPSREGASDVGGSGGWFRVRFEVRVVGPSFGRTFRQGPALHFTQLGDRQAAADTAESAGLRGLKAIESFLIVQGIYKKLPRNGIYWYPSVTYPSALRYSKPFDVSLPYMMSLGRLEQKGYSPYPTKARIQKGLEDESPGNRLIRHSLCRPPDQEICCGNPAEKLDLRLAIAQTSTSHFGK